MSKLTPVVEYRKDGSKNVKGYRIALQKTECERLSFENASLKIKYESDRIIITKEED